VSPGIFDKIHLTEIFFRDTTNFSFELLKFIVHGCGVWLQRKMTRPSWLRSLDSRRLALNSLLKMADLEADATAGDTFRDVPCSPGGDTKNESRRLSLPGADGGGMFRSTDDPTRLVLPTERSGMAGGGIRSMSATDPIRLPPLLRGSKLEMLFRRVRGDWNSTGKSPGGALWNNTSSSSSSSPF